MFHLLYLEWLKFKNNNVIVLLASLYFLLLPVVIFIGKQINLPKPFPGNEVFFTFPTTWDWMAYSGSWLAFFFLGFISLFIVTSEISYKTLRQNIITGFSRQQFFLAKVYTILFLAIVATLYFAIVTIGIGIVHTDNVSMEMIFSDATIIPRYFLMCMGYMSFGLFIGFLVKKSSLATLVYMVYILFVELLLKWQVHFKIVQNESINFWPMNSIEDLTPNPAMKMGDFITKQQLDFDFFLSPNEAMVSSSIYIILFLGVSYYYFLKKDL